MSIDSYPRHQHVLIGHNRIHPQDGHQHRSNLFLQTRREKEYRRRIDIRNIGLIILSQVGSQVQ